MAQVDASQRALDEIAIAKLEPLYCLAVDSGDLDLLLRICSPEAVERRGAREVRIHDAAAEMLRQMDRNFLSRFHTVTQSIVEIDGADSARSECCYLSRICVAASAERLDWMFGHEFAKDLLAVCDDRGVTVLTGGRYRSLCARHEGTWRIVQRQVITEWNECAPSREFFGGGVLAQARPSFTRS